MFEKIKKIPLFPLIFALSLVPSLYLLCNFYAQMNVLSYQQEEMFRLYKTERAAEKHGKANKEVLEEIQTGDPFYLDKHIETLSFLESEKKKLQALQLKGKATEIEEQRLHFLESENQLLFAEENIRQAKRVQEVEERQQSPIEINEGDLKKLLSFIEGIKIPPFTPEKQRPQIFIQDFNLMRKSNPLGEEIFELTMQLIKREKAK